MAEWDEFPIVEPAPAPAPTPQPSGFDEFPIVEAAPQVASVSQPMRFPSATAVQPDIAGSQAMLDTASGLAGAGWQGLKDFASETWQQMRRTSPMMMASGALGITDERKAEYDFRRAQEANRQPDQTYGEKIVEGSVKSLAKNLPLQALGGFPLVVGAAVEEEYASAFDKATQKGLPENDARGYALRSAAIEGTITAIMQKMGAGGMEGVLAAPKEAFKGTLKETLKGLGVSMLDEQIEELTIFGLQQLNDKMSNVNPDALSAKNLDEGAKLTMGTTALAAGAATGLRTVEAKAQAWRRANPDAPIPAAPTRAAFKEAGINEQLSKQEREEWIASLGTPTEAPIPGDVPTEAPAPEQVASEIGSPIAAPTIANAESQAPGAQPKPASFSEVIRKRFDRDDDKSVIHPEMLAGKKAGEAAISELATRVKQGDGYGYVVGLDINNQKGKNLFYKEDTNRVDKELMGRGAEFLKEELSKLAPDAVLIKHGGDEWNYNIHSATELSEAELFDAAERADAKFKAYAQSIGVPLDLENPRAKKPRYNRARLDEENQRIYDEEYEKYLKARGIGFRVGVTEVNADDTPDTVTSRIAEQHVAAKEGRPYGPRRQIAAPGAESPKGQAEGIGGRDRQADSSAGQEDGGVPQSTEGESQPAKAVDQPPAKPEDTVEYLGTGPADRKLVDSITSFQKDSINRFVDVIKGGSAPKTTRANRSAGEAVVRHASADTAAPRIADALYSKVFQGADEATANKMMAVLTEDNLRDIGEKSKDAVATLVGQHEGAAFKSEAEYQAALQDPKIQELIGRWKKHVNEYMNDTFRTLKGLDASEELLGRGKQTGARINLKAVREDGDVLTGGSGNINAARRNFSAFAKRATGQAEAYDTNAKAVLENSVARTWSKATRVRMLNSLINTGLAKFAEPGQQVKDIGGEPVSAIDVKIPEGGQQISKTLYVKSSLMQEIRGALGTDIAPEPIPAVKLMNTISLYGPLDSIFHVANVLTGITSSPGAQTFLGEVARKIPGANIADTLARVAHAGYEVVKGSPEIQQKLAELAKEGSLRGRDHDGISGKVIGLVDEASRIALDKMFDNLVKRGLMQDTPTSRREFINSATGQYQIRLQGYVTRWLRQYGISPFITAGSTFNRLGIKALAGGFGGEATSKSAARQMRATQIVGNIVVPVVTAAAINALLGADDEDKKDVPLGGIYLGRDEKGKPKYYDLLKFSGIRRGLNVSGLGPALEAVLAGRSPSKAFDEGVRTAFNSNIHPIAGPAAKALYSGATGNELAMGLPGGPMAQPGESQMMENIAFGAKKVNPLIEGAVDSYRETTTGKKSKSGSLSESLQKTLGSAAGFRTGRTRPTKAYELAQEFLRKRTPPSDAMTDEEKETSVVRRELTRAIREGKDPQEAIDEAVATNKVTEKQAFLSAKRGKLTANQAIFKALSLTEAKQVMDQATPAERSEWTPLYQDKIAARAKVLAKPKPLSSQGGKSLAERRESWEADISDAIRVLREVGATPDEIRTAYKAKMKAERRDSDDITVGLARLKQQLAKIDSAPQRGQLSPLAAR